MKKKLFALSGVFLIVLVLAGLWATKATNLASVDQTVNDTSAATSQATGLSMREMTQKASLIVIGQCAETHSRWVERRLVTDATILVGETLKGDATPGSVVTVELPGGISPNGRFQVAMTYAGAPQISPEEEVFLFLYRPVEDASSYSVMGFAQGKFSINKADDGEKVVMRDMTRAQVQKGAGLTRGNLQVIPLPEFKELVKSYLK